MSATVTRTVLMVSAGFVLLVVILALAAGFFGPSRQGAVPLSSAMIDIGGADIGGPFMLTDHTGTRVTEAAVITGPTLIYFGYTFCPDICPIDVQTLADATEILAERGIAIRPVFVTVDPLRDTPEALSDYVSAMHPRMVGLTGSEAEIRAAADAYKVYYQRAGSGEDYLMSHTGYLYMMTPERGITALFRNGIAPEQIAEDVARVLSAL